MSDLEPADVPVDMLVQELIADHGWPAWRPAAQSAEAVRAKLEEFGLNPPRPWRIWPGADAVSAAERAEFLARLDDRQAEEERMFAAVDDVAAIPEPMYFRLPVTPDPEARAALALASAAAGIR